MFVLRSGLEVECFPRRCGLEDERFALRFGREGGYFEGAGLATGGL